MKAGRIAFRALKNTGTIPPRQSKTLWRLSSGVNGWTSIPFQWTRLTVKAIPFTQSFQPMKATGLATIALRPFHQKTDSSRHRKKTHDPEQIRQPRSQSSP